RPPRFHGTVPPGRRRAWTLGASPNDRRGSPAELPAVPRLLPENGERRCPALLRHRALLETTRVSQSQPDQDPDWGPMDHGADPAFDRGDDARCPDRGHGLGAAASQDDRGELPPGSVL